MVNANAPALKALKPPKHGDELAQTENRVSTGPAVSPPQDDGAIWARAQNVCAEISAWQTISDSRSRGQPMTEAAANDAIAISNLLSQLKAQAVAYSDTSLDMASHAAIKDDMLSIINEWDKFRWREPARPKRNQPKSAAGSAGP